jgi:hypothetical protein
MTLKVRVSSSGAGSRQIVSQYFKTGRCVVARKDERVVFRREELEGGSLFATFQELESQVRVREQGRV